MNNNKELKGAYKQYKPDMGVYVFRCVPTGRAYIGYGQNMKADINSITFQLNLGSFISNRACGLQGVWKEFGEANFEVAVVESLEYAKDESKTDYSDDLKVLREVCSEKFGLFEFIQK